MGLGDQPNYQDIMGKLVADELKKMQGEDANFDPRGKQGYEIDKLTASIVENLIDDQKKGPGLEEAINSNTDMKYIVDRLMANPLIIPYVAAWLDDQLAEMTGKLDALFKSTFPSKEKEAGPSE